VARCRQPATHAHHIITSYHELSSPRLNPYKRDGIYLSFDLYHCYPNHRRGQSERSNPSSSPNATPPSIISTHSSHQSPIDAITTNACADARWRCAIRDEQQILTWCWRGEEDRATQRAAEKTSPSANMRSRATLISGAWHSLLRSSALLLHISLSDNKNKSQRKNKAVRATMMSDSTVLLLL